MIPGSDLSVRSVFVNAPIRKLISFKNERKLDTENPSGVKVGDFILFEETKGDLSHVAVATGTNEVVHLWTVTGESEMAAYDGFKKASIAELIDRYCCAKTQPKIPYSGRDDDSTSDTRTVSFKSMFEAKRSSILVYACTPPWITNPKELTEIADQVMEETKKEIKERFGIDEKQLERQVKEEEQNSDVDSNETTCSCYITTACVMARGLSDDCHELMTLRQFRDDYMRQFQQGSTLIETYYQYAPAIVKAIDRSPHSRSVYESLYTVIQDCVRQIEQKQFTAALRTYTNMVLQLGADYTPHFIPPRCLTDEALDAEIGELNSDEDGEEED
ncbi:MAG: CFI-box-CTERM domain-containing protein [Cyanobacteria bacterium P01_G01_bin.54]